MSTLMQFKTYGALMTALKRYLTEASKEAHRRHFGTAVYFQERANLLHAAFDRFANEHGFSAETTPALLRLVTSHAKHYPEYRDAAMNVLTNELPDDFNVRGAWTSPRLREAEVC